jgi:cell division control protein 6
MSGNIFLSGVPKNRIFRDKRVFTVGYLPKRLIARDHEIETVKELFYPILQDHSKPENALIYGKSGTGKSAVVRYVLNDLMDYLDQEEGHRRYLPVHIECTRHTTVTILTTILRELNPDLVVPRCGLATSTYYDIVWEQMIAKNQNLILVLDEIDKLRDDRILYMVTRAAENCNIPEDLHISVIGISNSLEYVKRLDSRVISSMGKTDLIFSPYNAPQLEQILTDRLIGFQEGVLDEGVIGLCAGLSAQVGGDARKALQLLRRAGIIAERESRSLVTEEDVNQAYAEIAADTLSGYIEVLPVQEKAILLTIAFLVKEGKEKIYSGDVYLNYTRLAEVLDLRVLSSPRVSGVISQLEVEDIIKTNVAKKEGRGMSREIYLIPDLKKVWTAICEDFRFAQFQEQMV